MVYVWYSTNDLNSVTSGFVFAKCHTAADHSAETSWIRLKLKWKDYEEYLSPLMWAPSWGEIERDSSSNRFLKSLHIMGVIHANVVKEKKPASSTGCELCKVRKCTLDITLWIYQTFGVSEMSLQRQKQTFQSLKSKMYASNMLRNLSYCEPTRNGMRVFKLCWYLCFLGGGPGSL